jgi:hypothetical protein
MRAEPLPELAAAYLELTQARACLEIGPHVALPTTSAARIACQDYRCRAQRWARIKRIGMSHPSLSG